VSPVVLKAMKKGNLKSFVSGERSRALWALLLYLSFTVFNTYNRKRTAMLRTCTILFIHTHYFHVSCTMLSSPRCRDVASVQRRRLGAETSPRCRNVASVQKRRLGAETSPRCKDVASVQRRAHNGRGQVNWVKCYPLVWKLTFNLFLYFKYQVCSICL